MSDILHLPQSSLGQLQPVVILGAPRSGTKFLRDTLGSSAEAISIPYDVNHIWTRFVRPYRDDAFPPSALDERSACWIRRRLNQFADRTLKPRAHFLIEKTVSNTLRLDTVLSVLPNARVLHLMRDGCDVVESVYRCWLEPPSRDYLQHKLRYFGPGDLPYMLRVAGDLVRGRLRRRGTQIWGPRFPNYEVDLRDLPLHLACARQWRWCAGSAHEAVNRMPPDRVCHVRYERLIDDESELLRVCDFLGISDVSTVVRYYAANLLRPTAYKWLRTFDATQRGDILDEIGPTLIQLGYDGARRAA